MLRKNKEKAPKYQMPTIDEFLGYIPRRLDFEWTEDTEGLIEIKVPKFNGNFGKSFLKLIRKDNTLIGSLDKMGSVVWKNCDGKKTVKQILGILEKEFPNQKELDQRLFLFIQQMGSLNYIVY